MNLHRFVRKIGRKYGKGKLNKGLLEAIIWGHTGFPCFFGSDKPPMVQFEEQIIEFFAKWVATGKIPPDYLEQYEIDKERLHVPEPVL